jgi:hypothetical protein
MTGFDSWRAHEPEEMEMGKRNPQVPESELIVDASDRENLKMEVTGYGTRVYPGGINSRAFVALRAELSQSVRFTGSWSSTRGSYSRRDRR